jgi:hypothetical protein
MKIITQGHRYELENFEQKEADGQRIQFIEKRPKSEGSTELETVNDGTTNEELIKVLIDRLTFLHQKFPSDENFYTLGHLKQALYCQQSRTYERQQRGVEGKHQK